MSFWVPIPTKAEKLHHKSALLQPGSWIENDWKPCGIYFCETERTQSFKHIQTIIYINWCIFGFLISSPWWQAWSSERDADRTLNEATQTRTVVPSSSQLLTTQAEHNPSPSQCNYCSQSSEPHWMVVALVTSCLQILFCIFWFSLPSTKTEQNHQCTISVNGHEESISYYILTVMWDILIIARRKPP